MNNTTCKTMRCRSREGPLPTQRCDLDSTTYAPLLMWDYLSQGPLISLATQRWAPLFTEYFILIIGSVGKMTNFFYYNISPSPLKQANNEMSHTSWRRQHFIPGREHRVQFVVGEWTVAFINLFLPSVCLQLFWRHGG